MKLAAQVFVSHTVPDPEKIEPVVDRHFWKPSGGLWTSTLDDEGGQWVRWLNGEGYSLEDERWGGKLWLLQPAEANLLQIWSPRELYDVVERYPHPLREAEMPLRDPLRTLVDWAKAAEDYDGFHVPNPWPWRFGIGGEDLGASMFFYSMDAECTCWFRWCFEGDPEEIDATPFLERLNAA